MLQTFSIAYGIRSIFLANPQRGAFLTTKPNRTHLSLLSPLPASSSSFSSSSTVCNHKPGVHYDSLRVLEWDKLCDSVASFACSSLGRDATKTQLLSLDQTYEESLKLLDETNAAIIMLQHGSFSLDLTGVNLSLVESGVLRARRGLPLQADQALAMATLVQFSETLQLNLKAAVKQDADWYTRLMPLSQMITQLVINRSLFTMIQRVIDEDGSIKDSASTSLRQSRDRVRSLERKLNQLMDSLIRSQKEKASAMEVTSIDGRWCIQAGVDQLTSFKGLLLTSVSGTGIIIEPISAVPLNDELQHARVLVAKAEADVLMMLTEKIQMDLDAIEKMLNCLIQLDVINARATYSLSYGGTCPNIYLPEEEAGFSTDEDNLPDNKSTKESSPRKEWMLYLPRCYHPLLLQQYRNTVRKHRKGVKDTTAGGAVKQVQPVPVDFLIPRSTRVLVITGPNTGGKTICLKTVGLAAMMAKSGLHVLASESACIPWFDNVYADIGDEQSLLQSLSTFSGHMKQISEIRSHSTSRSLVLLDEVGAGTNPLEGAALGMALLESFAESGAFLTMATTHHGELKTLKYSNGVVENACMEFDDVNLKPTYKILWGVPGRSNAINVAERLGLPRMVVNNARDLYGAASAEINEVIVGMERSKQEFHELVNDARHYLRLSRNLCKNLLLSERKIKDHAIGQRYKMRQELSSAGATARSMFHRRAQQLRASVALISQSTKPMKSQPAMATADRHGAVDKTADHMMTTQSSSAQIVKQLPSEDPAKRGKRLPGVGGLVYLTSLGKRATVLSVEPSKEEITVQVGNMRLKLKLADVEL